MQNRWCEVYVHHSFGKVKCCEKTIAPFLGYSCHMCMFQMIKQMLDLMSDKDHQRLWWLHLLMEKAAQMYLALCEKVIELTTINNIY